MEVVISVLGVLLLATWAYLLLLVFGFEHQNVAKVHDQVIEALRQSRRGDQFKVQLILSGITGTIEGTWSYPWVRYKESFDKANKESVS